MNPLPPVTSPRGAPMGRPDSSARLLYLEQEARGWEANCRIAWGEKGRLNADLAAAGVHTNALLADRNALRASLARALSWMETHKRFNNVGDSGPLAADIAEARALLSRTAL